MRKENNQKENEEVIVAHEGFVDSRYESFLENHNARIIEYRTLSDCPMVHTICYHHPEDH